jgi:hypothetical protein
LVARGRFKAVGDRPVGQIPVEFASESANFIVTVATIFYNVHGGMLWRRRFGMAEGALKQRREP